ncbi:MAG: arsenosugar biosynthesis-associated peroxidase-like protein [Bacteroidota bacterium]
MSNHTQNIGHLSGPLLIFGGVYSNLHALEALKKKAKELSIPPENIICTGDIAGYCAFPDECIKTIRDWGIHAIVGNVEENIRDGLEECGCGFDDNSRCDLFSRMWYPYAQKNTSEESVAYLKELPSQITFVFGNVEDRTSAGGGIPRMPTSPSLSGAEGLRGRKLRIVHGGLHHTSQFVWRSTPWSVKEEQFQESGADVIIGGHCGLPFAERSPRGHELWLNAGVIGMPANDGTTDVWFLTLDEEEGELTYQFHRLAYDHVAARAAMLERPLPKSYALTLKTGIWDNTEIMPPAEASWEGQAYTEQFFRTEKVLLKRPSKGDIEAATSNRVRKSEKEKNSPLGTPGGSFTEKEKTTQNRQKMNQYYDPKDLKKFGTINEYQEEMGEQFFQWYENATHGDSALTQREKALIALAVSHALHCPYCVDAYTTAALESGADEEQMMEAVHTAAAVQAGSTLIYGVQMKRQIEKLTM